MSICSRSRSPLAGSGQKSGRDCGGSREELIRLAELGVSPRGLEPGAGLPGEIARSARIVGGEGQRQGEEGLRQVLRAEGAGRARRGRGRARTARGTSRAGRGTGSGRVARPRGRSWDPDPREARGDATGLPIAKAGPQRHQEHFDLLPMTRPWTCGTRSDSSLVPSCPSRSLQCACRGHVSSRPNRLAAQASHKRQGVHGRVGLRQRMPTRPRSVR